MHPQRWFVLASKAHPSRSAMRTTFSISFFGCLGLAIELILTRSLHMSTIGKNSNGGEYEKTPLPLRHSLTHVTQLEPGNRGFSRGIFKTSCKSRDYKSALGISHYSPPYSPPWRGARQGGVALQGDHPAFQMLCSLMHHPVRLRLPPLPRGEFSNPGYAN